MIPVKNKQQIHFIENACKIVVDTMRMLRHHLKPGVTTLYLDEIANKHICSFGAVSAFWGYSGNKKHTMKPYPGHICTSINDEVIHGIPNNRVLKNGDIISIDIGVCYKNWYGDMAWTFPIGDISKETQKLLDVTKQALYAGIKQARKENRLYDISAAIQNCVERENFSVVRQFVGHGVGKSLHEEPQIPNFKDKGNGPRLEPGMVFAIEPMTNAGISDVLILDDGWTAVTKDGKISAHFEHTVCITDEEPQILTQWE